MGMRIYALFFVLLGRELSELKMSAHWLILSEMCSRQP